MAGVRVQSSPWNKQATKRVPFQQFGNPADYTAAATTQANDYDTIMKQYDDLIAQNNQNPVTANNVKYEKAQNTTTQRPANVQAQQINTPEDIKYANITPQQIQYQKSADLSKSLSNLSDLATNGGYTAQGIADIRARDISPTRSIYASGRQNLERNRTLNGGYSPNFAAASSQMARDESNQVANVTTAANAGIAQAVAANKLRAAGDYAGAAQAENAARTAVDEFNAGNVNRANEFNSTSGTDVNKFNSNTRMRASEANQSAINAINEANANRQTQSDQFNTSSANQMEEFNAANELNTNTGNANRQLEAQRSNKSGVQAAIQGKTSLYGTTPALTNTFGNQVIQAGQLGQGQQQLNQARRRSIFGVAGGY